MNDDGVPSHTSHVIVAECSGYSRVLPREIIVNFFGLHNSHNWSILRFMVTRWVLLTRRKHRVFLC